MEAVERRRLMATDLASLIGQVRIDLSGDGLTADDIPVAIDTSGDLVAPTAAGARGVDVSLFRDDGDTAGVFDANDSLVGTQTTDLADGSYRFDRLTAGNYFVQQVNDVNATPPATIDGLNSPSLNTPILVNITEANGEQTVAIDAFTDNSESNFDATPTATTLERFQSGLGGTIGTERDIRITNTANNGTFGVFIGANSGLISITSGANGTGTALIQYDGVDGELDLEATGLGSLSLGGGSPGEAAAEGAGLIFDSRAQVAGDSLTIVLYSNANDFSTATVSLPANTELQELFVPFTEFGPPTGGGGGNGVDFNSVGAIEVTVNIGQANNDLDVSLIEARQPDLFTQNLLNIQPLTLGGEIFTDISDNGRNNGTRESNEAAFTTPVTVQLYADTGGAFDPDAQAPVATTTTDQLGQYEFVGIDPGDYRIVIPADQFADNSGNANDNGPLFGFASSLFTDTPPDPDDNVEGDDNGQQAAVAGAIVTLPITLVSQSEPDSDDDDDDDDDDNGFDNVNRTVDFGVIPTVDLVVGKIVRDNSNLTAGGTAVFRITVNNVGPLDATDVVVTDVLPVGLIFDSLDNTTFTPTVVGQQITIPIGTVAAGGVIEFDILTNVDNNQTDDLSNTGVVATPVEIDVNLDNNESTVQVNLIETDLRITKVASAPVFAGGQLTYTITVTNDGPDAASGVFVTDTLPADTTFASGNVQLPGEDGSVDNSNLFVRDPNDASGGRDLLINLGSLANDAVAVITIVTNVNADSVDQFNNTATVDLTPDTDPNTANDSDNAQSDVTRNVDLAINKTTTGTPVGGGTINYQISVDNIGLGTARGLSVTDLLPDGAVFAGNLMTTDGVTLVQDGGDDDDGDETDNLVFSLPDLTPDGSPISFSFDVTLDAGLDGNLVNTATVATTDNDTDATNDTSSVTVDVGQSFNLTIEKTVNAADTTPGDDDFDLTYTIVVTNEATSLSTAPDIRVSDLIPAGLTGVLFTAPNSISSEFTAGTVIVDYASLAPGESQTITITSSVNSGATADIVNTATVASTTAAASETNPNDNSDSVTTTLTPDFDIVVTKAVSGSDTDFGPGETVVFNVGLQNTGDSDVTGFTLSDPVPAGLTFASATIGGTAATLVGGVPTFANLTLVGGATRTAVFTFTVNPDASGTITNTATVPAVAGETDTTNNAASANITATPQSDVRVTKTVNLASANPGDQLVYTITAINAGPSPAAAVTITDTLPANLTFNSATGPNGQAITATNGVITFNGGTLADDGSFVITVTATIDSDATGSVVNPVSVSTTTPESNAANNNGSATTAIVVPQVFSSIAGSVYVDANNNGVRDANEAGIAGVTLTLTGTATGGAAVPTATVVTNANGNYLFGNLPAGTFRIVESQPDGFIDGIETVGTPPGGAVATDNVFSQIGLGEDIDAVDFNFGELAPTLSKRRFLNHSA